MGCGGACYNGGMRRGYRDIFVRQTFTLFNLVNVVLALLIFWTGSYQNLFFIGTLVTNWLIGIVQEVRSRRTLDKLALMHQNTYVKLDHGKKVTITLDAVKAGDELLIGGGDQVPCDGVLVSGEVYVDESLLTGESDLLVRQASDFLRSGTFVESGHGVLRAEQAGENTYVADLERRALDHKKYPSQLRDAIQTIIKFCTIAIFPMGILLFVRGYGSTGSLRQAILHMAAALIGMIPQGLVVLASVALAIASVKLAREHVLVQELYCSENLARTDILCLDKTGTITTGNMRVEAVMPEGMDAVEFGDMVGRLFAAVDDNNATARAIKKKFPCTEAVRAEGVVPFSSRTRYVQATIDGHIYRAGATEKIAPEKEKDAQKYAAEGLRVLSVSVDGRFAGFVLFGSELRADVKQTLKYFKEQGVQLCVISGDDPATVAWAAHEAGIEGRAVNMAGVTDDEIPELMKSFRIFGRTDPSQKAAMVKALQGQGHTVAMTGDGVNDVLALKQADCSIAMGSGSQAARTVASLVLLNDQFDDLPSIVLQGRRAINNIQRTSSLFLVKTMFSFALALLTILLFGTYPFQPVQLTLISALTAGIPSFVLTLEPNDKQVTGNFLSNVLRQAVPGAVNVVGAILIAWIVLHNYGNQNQFSTVCTVLAGVNALSVLVMVCRPMTKIRLLLTIGMTAGFFAGIFFFRNILLLVPLEGMYLWTTIILCTLEPFTLYVLKQRINRK